MRMPQPRAYTPHMRRPRRRTPAGATLYRLTVFKMPQNCFGNWATIPVLSMSAMCRICS
jgi:hypothetical protein